jgi:aspartate/methionine/tyrosine aminotransferase
VRRLKACRDALVPQLAALPGIELAMPDAGMYAFFRVQGQADSLAFAKRLVAEVGLGLAPGVAFGREAEGWLRWCFATRDLSRLTDGVQRLARVLTAPPGRRNTSSAPRATKGPLRGPWG